MPILCFPCPIPDKEMHPRVQVTAFEALFAPPGAELEQQERMGPGFGSSCDQEWRIVRGKLLRVMNPSNHFSFVAPEGACGDPDDASSPGGKEQEMWRLGELSRGVDMRCFAKRSCCT